MSTTSYIGRKVKLTDEYIDANPKYVRGGINEGTVLDSDGACWVVKMNNGTEAVPFVPNHSEQQCILLEETQESAPGHTILDTAKGLIYGDRLKDYGKTVDNFNAIAVGWTEIAKTPLTPEQVGLMMIWLKVCRANNDNCKKEDNIIDIAGYAGCIEKIKKGL
jgi:hypothetical protein